MTRCDASFVSCVLEYVGDLDAQISCGYAADHV
jgi:hypothetical protein